MTWPSNPTDGQEHEQGSQLYYYDASLGAWRKRDRYVTDLAVANVGPATLEVTSSTGAGATLPAATPSAAGVMPAADSAKLAGIEAGATGDQVAAEVAVTPSGPLVADDVQEALEALAAATDPTGRVARQNISGGASIDVSGVAAAELTLIGNLASLDFTGWAADNTAHQAVRVRILQDAIGGRSFDWRDVAGTWVETPPDSLSTVADGTTLQFYAVSNDGGDTVWLEPIGVEYSPGCAYMLANEIAVPDVEAGGTVTINHAYSFVASVELINVATGQRVLADYRRAAPVDPQSAILIDFSNAAPAGTWLAVVAGVASQPCDLSISADSEWQSIVLSVAGAGTVSPTVAHDGSVGDVEWVWGDGSPHTEAVSNVAANHTYSPAYTGQVVLRYKRGVTITVFDVGFENAWDFDTSVLSGLTELTYLRVSNNPVTGKVADFARMTSLGTLSAHGTNLGPALNPIAAQTQLTALQLYSTNVYGDIGAVASITGLTQLQVYDTDIDGDVAGLAGLTALQRLDIYNTDIHGDLAALSAMTSLTALNIFGTSIEGDIAALAALTALIQLQAQSLNLDGDVAALAGMTAATFINLAATNVDGDVADLAPLTLLATLYLQSTAVTGDPSVLATAIAATLTRFTYHTLDVAPTVASLDGTIAALAAGSISSGTLDLGGTNPPITNNAGVTTLQGRSWTVTHN